MSPIIIALLGAVLITSVLAVGGMIVWVISGMRALTPPKKAREVTPVRKEIVAAKSPDIDPQVERNRAWAALADRLKRIDLAVIKEETDPRVYLMYPLILDLSTDTTKNFHEKWAIARGLIADAPVPRDNLTLYQANKAMSLAEQAWSAALVHAKNAGLPDLSDEVRKMVLTARNALNLANDETATLPERTQAVELAQKLIKKILPEMTATIDNTFETFRLPIDSAARAELGRVG